MSLPVSGQVSAGGVILATLCTRVFWLDIFYLRLLLLGTAVTCKKGLEQQSKHPVGGEKFEFYSLTSYVYAVVGPPPPLLSEERPLQS